MPRKELHQLIDALPEKEIPLAKRFLEFLLNKGGKELTPKQVAKKVNTTPSKIRKLLREGKLPGRKVGREWLISEGDLETVLDPNAYFGAKILGSGEGIE
ncbi:MAG: helix-turn-helix domain-containing protein [Firmicutes bacterium]|nr:helix-turn-helix domain-containing protein [Bacillota bacterium]